MRLNKKTNKDLELKMKTQKKFNSFYLDPGRREKMNLSFYFSQIFLLWFTSF